MKSPSNSGRDHLQQKPEHKMGKKLEQKCENSDVCGADFIEKRRKRYRVEDPMRFIMFLISWSHT